ncbi:MAG TPA: universal stress protein [Candidatus Dormibacteraeota bacterium]|nr:universal stress protein [Candidatus Dormibacteraeota bacterium]
MTFAVSVHPVGAVFATVIFVSTVTTLWWMLHPPKTKAEEAAEVITEQVEEIVSTVVVVMSAATSSAHMLPLAMRIASRQKANVLVVYVIEVPMQLPVNAAMTEEERHALESLAAAQAIAKKSGVELRTETVKTRNMGQAIVQIANVEHAHLLVLGTVRRAHFSGNPFSGLIEYVSAHAPCDVMIGVRPEGEASKMLGPLKVEIG